ncbi:hypothetical protein HYH03_004857 [Edaphochlamys debaryana]|uniref:Uncharacterized protein n=1 Tax=Edaphochlamys debaryana TaxID=47281 RepID=A0A835Y9K7_9CHLO|nr:hypothetical protein HYH03_004857 [Edaphochlamys debaryana]|eukprot:KAG2497273.1 hypothetical protein HYH03_004857 [Edaphochlamys debaryana]
MQVKEASQAIRDISDSSVWTAVPIEGRAGLAAIYALALRRSGPQEGGSDGLRAAYAELRHQLALGLEDLKCGESGDAGPALPLTPSRQLCLALLEGDVCPAFAALLHASSSALQFQKPHPPRRSLQAAKDLLVEVDHVLSWVDRVNTAHKSGPTAASGPDATVSAKFDSAISSTAPHTLVWEHWARLILVLAGIEGAEDTAAIEADRLGIVFPELEARDGYLNWDPPVGPCLAFLLISHLVNLSAALDGGLTLGLPAGAASASGAGPSSSAGPSSALFMPLADTEGRRLQLGPRRPPGASPANINLALSALNVPPPPPPSPLLSVAGLAPGMFALALDRAAALEAVARAWSEEPESGVMGQACLTSQRGKLDLCVKLQAALQRGDVLFNWAATFEVGMRLAGAAAVQLCRMGAFAESEASVRSLHAPSAWRPVQGPPSPPGAASSPPRTHGAALLDEADAVTLGTIGLRLTRNVLSTTSMVYDRGQGFQGRPPAWLRRRLVAWWSAMLAWAQHGPTSFNAEAIMQLSAGCVEDGLPAQPSLDIAAALAAGYLPAVERMRRVPPVKPTDKLFRSKPGAPSAWPEVLAFAEPAQALAFVATVGKELAMARALVTTTDSALHPAALQGVLQSCQGPVFACTPGAGLAPALVRYPGAAAVPDQWPMVMSCAAVRLLEPLACILEAAAAELLTHSRGEHTKFTQPLTVDLVALLLEWVPSVVAACCAYSLGAPNAEVRGGAGLAPAAEPAAAVVAAGPSPAAVVAAKLVARLGPAHSMEFDTDWETVLYQKLHVNALVSAALDLAWGADDGQLQALKLALVPALWAIVVRAPLLVGAWFGAAALYARQEDPDSEPSPVWVTLAGLRRVLGPGGPLPQPALLAQFEYIRGAFGEQSAPAAARAVGAAATTSVGAGAGAHAAASGSCVRPSGSGAGSSGSGAGPSGSDTEPSGSGAWSSGLGAEPSGPATAEGWLDPTFNRDAWPEEVRRYQVAPSLLRPCKQARALLPGCANPECINLAGPSEAALPGIDSSGAGCG